MNNKLIDYLVPICSKPPEDPIQKNRAFIVDEEEYDDLVKILEEKKKRAIDDRR